MASLLRDVPYGKLPVPGHRTSRIETSGKLALGGAWSGHEKMIHHFLIQPARRGIVRSTRRWIFHLGALGFIPLGLLDASIIPLPGSMDVLTIVLASRHALPWIYYAVMATVGSVIGELVTYRLARRGGEEMVAGRVSEATRRRVYAAFEHWGFSAIAVPALLPPIPLLPFVLAAGALRYSQYKFAAAIAAGRIVRFTILAYLADRYGRGILKVLSRNGHWLIVGILAVLLAAAGITLFFVFRSKRKKPAPAVTGTRAQTR